MILAGRNKEENSCCRYSSDAFRECSKEKKVVVGDVQELLE